MELDHKHTDETYLNKENTCVENASTIPVRPLVYKFALVKILYTPVQTKVTTTLLKITSLSYQ